MRSPVFAERIFPDFFVYRFLATKYTVQTDGLTLPTDSPSVGV
jgi:hypothetical protein